MNIIEETALAARTTFLYGEHQLKADTIATVLRGFRRFYGASTDIATFMDESTGSSTNGYTSIRDAFSAVGGGMVFNLHWTLESEFFRAGGLLTLEQWLHLCKDREATDARDLIYAGLSIIKPESLKIDKDLQLGILESVASDRCLEKSSGSFRRHHDNASHLWEELYPTYTVGEPEVMLNLAACLLSKPQGIDNLFRIVLRFRDPIAIALPELSSKIWNGPLRDIPDLPSWVPNPTIRVFGSVVPLPRFGKPTWRDFKRLQWRITPRQPYSPFASPRISHDGSILYVSAARVATISTYAFSGRMVSRHSPCDMTEFLRWIVQAVPRNTARSSGLLALASALAAGRWNGRPIDSTNREEVLSYFCAGLCWCTYGTIADMDPASPDVASVMMQWPFAPFSAPSEDDKLELLKAYHELTAAFSDQPWPKPPALWKGKPMRTKYLNRAWAYWAQLLPRMTSLAIFATKEGYMGLGPPSIREGDVVMLTDTELPYVFAHVDNVAERKMRDIELKLNHTLGRKKRKVLEGARSELEGKIGTRDAWELVGEAYLDVYIGEEEEEALLGRIERLSIV